jgi:hypothetical protein
MAGNRRRAASATTSARLGSTTSTSRRTRIAPTPAWLIAAKVGADGWPGRRAMSTGMVGGFPLDSGEYLWLVHREVPIPAIPPAQARLSRFEPAPEYSQPLENARVLVGIDVDGAPSAIMECRVKDTRFDRKDPAAGESA